MSQIPSIIFLIRQKKIAQWMSIQVIVKWISTELSHMSSTLWRRFNSSLTFLISVLQHYKMKKCYLWISLQNIFKCYVNNIDHQFSLKWNSNLDEASCIFGIWCRKTIIEEKRLIFITVKLTDHPVLVTKFNSFSSRMWWDNQKSIRKDIPSRSL